ncbi:MAG: ATP-dependent nuclease [Oceanicaulis sp.]
MHPLSKVGVKISGFKSFYEDGIEIQKFEPINIIIGKNNAGKSSVISALNSLTGPKSFLSRDYHLNDVDFNAILFREIDEPLVRQFFPESTCGGGIPGNSWWSYGKNLIGGKLEQSVNAGGVVSNERVHPPVGTHIGYLDEAARVLSKVSNPFSKLNFLRVAAERDVLPEAESAPNPIASNGSGTTNLIRAFINRADLPRDLVQRDLIEDLNEIYKGDAKFGEILAQQIDENGKWEIFLDDYRHQDIPLSQTGSGLKTIIIILSILHLSSELRNIDWDNVVFCIEEPENNLHPALLRKLLNYLARRREELGFALIITSHSASCIDWASKRDDSQVIHVRSCNLKSEARIALGYSSNKAIITELDFRASDVLQANCVIWVEGPSDRIYLNEWIRQFSDLDIVEGAHYSIMFYGGRLLSHLDALPPGEARDRISLLSINSNVAVIIDSDRKLAKSKNRKPRMNINETKRRIKQEVEGVDGFVWVTEGKEIENYIPADWLKSEYGVSVRTKYDDVPKLVTKALNRSHPDKISLANSIQRNTSIDWLKGSHDLPQRMNEMLSFIKRSNSL